MAPWMVIHVDQAGRDARRAHRGTMDTVAAPEHRRVEPVVVGVGLPIHEVRARHLQRIADRVHDIDAAPFREVGHDAIDRLPHGPRIAVGQARGFVLSGSRIDSTATVATVPATSTLVPSSAAAASRIASPIGPTRGLSAGDVTTPTSAPSLVTAAPASGTDPSNRRVLKRFGGFAP